jgi:hypothetical protein|eukprot:SAG25_NODE_225_length_11569_cov_7.091107_6_plen_199_part_00
MQRQHLLPGFDNENRGGNRVRAYAIMMGSSCSPLHVCIAALEKQRIEAFSREISQVRTGSFHAESLHCGRVCGRCAWSGSAWAAQPHWSVLCWQSLQQCDISVKRVSASEQVPAQEVRVRSNARTSLATQLHELSRKYRKEHDSYLSSALPNPRCGLSQMWNVVCELTEPVVSCAVQKQSGKGVAALVWTPTRATRFR